MRTGADDRTPLTPPLFMHKIWPPVGVAGLGTDPKKGEAISTNAQSDPGGFGLSNKNGGLVWFWCNENNDRDWLIVMR